MDKEILASAAILNSKSRKLRAIAEIIFLKSKSYANPSKKILINTPVQTLER